MYDTLDIVVAIDGPAGAGKSTVSRQLARQLQLTYIDTGAMYRAVTWLALEQNIAIRDAHSLAHIADTLSIRFVPSLERQSVFVNGIDVTDAIRSHAVGEAVPTVSAHPEVRAALVHRQQAMSKTIRGLVMDGRDIGTHVLPDADVKIYLTASEHQRALRRHAELVAKGYEGSVYEVRETIEMRDAVDQSRDASPLRPAHDAVHLDTTSLTQDEVVAMIVALCQTRALNKEVSER